MKHRMLRRSLTLVVCPCLAAAIVAITVNSGACLAEVVRGALLSIPKGLTEAGSRWVFRCRACC